MSFISINLGGVAQEQATLRTRKYIRDVMRDHDMDVNEAVKVAWVDERNQTMCHTFAQLVQGTVSRGLCTGSLTLPELLRYDPVVIRASKTRMYQFRNDRVLRAVHAHCELTDFRRETKRRRLY